MWSMAGTEAELPYNIRPDAFAGTARYYTRYRLPYPDVLMDDLRMRTGITGKGRLLDLGTGPGRVALPLASFFDAVWAVDLEPEMIDVGREESTRLGFTNIRWLVGRAEDVDAPPCHFELITIGEAFHRLDQPLILKRALEWLPSGRFLVTMGGSFFKGPEPWKTALREAEGRWKGRITTGQSVGGKVADPPRGPSHNRDVMQAAGFADVGDYEFTVPHVWDLDSVIGCLYSSSVCSRHALGDRASDFGADIRRALLACDPRGEYPDVLQFGYTLARRP